MKKFADSDFIKKVAKYAKIGVDHVYKTVSDLEILLNTFIYFVITECVTAASYKYVYDHVLVRETM